MVRILIVAINVFVLNVCLVWNSICCIQMNNGMDIALTLMQHVYSRVQIAYIYFRRMHMLLWYSILHISVPRLV